MGAADDEALTFTAAMQAPAVHTARLAHELEGPSMVSVEGTPLIEAVNVCSHTCQNTF